MAVQLLPPIRQQFLNASGVPLVGGQLFSYLAGTTTPIATYTDASGVVPNTNPIILDSAGECDVWVIPGVQYKFILEDANSALQWTRDNISIQELSTGSAVPVITGSRGTPQSITAAGGIAFAGAWYLNIWYIQGSSSAVTITANPQIAAGLISGQELLLIGRNNTNTVTISNGTGLDLDGPCTLGAGANIRLIWDGTNWCETERSQR